MPSRLFSSLRGYRGGWLRGDVVAGLTVWAVLVPEALAYAQLAGVSPVVGLYAAPGALILYAAFASSPNLVTAPMSATAALSAGTVGAYATGGSSSFTAMTAALAISTGFAALLAGFVRFGFIASFISTPVLKGFIIGLALTIIAGQLPAMLGVSKGSGDFFEQVGHVIAQLGHLNVPTLLIGLLSLALVLGLRALAPAIPGALVAVVIGTLVVSIFDLSKHGVAIVGPIARGLPPIGVPDVTFADYVKLLAGGFGIMLVGFAEGLGTAKEYASADRVRIDPDRELIALGAANLAAGLSGGMVVNGGVSKTAVNVAAGARTQLSGLLAAAMTILTLLLLTGLFAKLPNATLAGVVIAAVIELVDFPAVARLYRVYSERLARVHGIAARPDFIATVAALLGVTVFDTLPGLFIGIAVSMLLLVYRISRPRIAELGRVPGTRERYADSEEHPDHELVPGIVILRVESGLFFGNAETVSEHISAAAARPGIDTVILDAGTMPFLDVTAIEMLDDLTDSLERDGVQLLLARAIGPVREVLRTGVSDERRARVYPTVQAAVDGAARAERQPS